MELENLDFSKFTLSRVLKCFNLPSSPHTSGRGQKGLIGNKALFRSSSLGAILSSVVRISAVQSNHKTPSMNQDRCQDPTESTGTPEFISNSRSSQNTTDILWCISLYVVKTSRVLQVISMQEHSLTVCGILFIFFLNITHLLKHLRSAKHHMPSDRTASSKTLHDTTDF